MVLRLRHVDANGEYSPETIYCEDVQGLHQVFQWMLLDSGQWSLMQNGAQVQIESVIVLADDLDHLGHLNLSYQSD